MIVQKLFTDKLDLFWTSLSYISYIDLKSIMDICSYKTVFTLIKVLSLKVLALLPSFNKNTWSLHPTLPAWYIYYFCKYFQF